MRIFMYVDSAGQEVEMVEIEDGQGGASQMTKAAWDEQQAQTNKIGVVTNGDN